MGWIIVLGCLAWWLTLAIGLVVGRAWGRDLERRRVGATVAVMLRGAPQSARDPPGGTSPMSDP